MLYFEKKYENSVLVIFVSLGNKTSNKQVQSSLWGSGRLFSWHRKINIPTMATVHKIREGFFLISWNNPIRTSTKQTTVNIDEISLSCQLCYTANGGRTRTRTTSLFMEFQLPLTKEKYPKTLEPSRTKWTLRVLD